MLLEPGRRFIVLGYLLVAWASGTRAQTKVVLTNDDGWATANIRQQYTSLTEAGYNVSLPSSASIFFLLMREMR